MCRSLSLLLSLGLACTSASTSESAWVASDGAASWDDTQEVCGPLLEKGQAIALGRGGADGAIDPRAPYDNCMKQQGWVLRDDADEQSALAMREEVDAFLSKEVEPRRDAEALGEAFGVARCHAVDAANQICAWEFEYRSRIAAASYPTVLTCILPKDGSPRGEGSCQMDAK